MKKKFKPTFDNLELKQVSFAITIEDYLQLNQAAVKAKMTISDLLRRRLGYPTAKELKTKRLKRINPFYNN
jgi:hypothetical protein